MFNSISPPDDILKFAEFSNFLYPDNGRNPPCIAAVELLNGDSSSSPPILPIFHGPNQEEITPPSFEEVQSAIRRLKNHKSPGSDGIAAEMLKAGGDVLHKHIYEIICDIWHKETMPDDWNESIVCPIYKKGNSK